MHMKENWFLFSASRCIIDWYGCCAEEKGRVDTPCLPDGSCLDTNTVCDSATYRCVCDDHYYQHDTSGRCRMYYTSIIRDEVWVWLSGWSEMQIVCIWSSWCHCHPKPHHVFRHLNPDWFYLSATGLPRLSWERGRWTGAVNGCSK